MILDACPYQDIVAARGCGLIAAHALVLHTLSFSLSERYQSQLNHNLPALARSALHLSCIGRIMVG